MSELQKAVRRALDEWRDDPGSVRMASLMIALQDALAEESERYDLATVGEVGVWGTTHQQKDSQ